MAYPIQRHSSFPQTPQFPKGGRDTERGVDTPPRIFRRVRPNLPSFRNAALTLFTLFILGLTFRPIFMQSTDQLDRLPYSAERTVE